MQVRPRLRSLSALSAAALLLGALSAAAPARAQNASDQAVARSLFDEGAKLYAAGNYPEACAKLEASYHLFAGIGTRGKLAECYEKVGRTASAWAMYREVVALAGKAGDSGREKVAGDRAAALEPTLAHLTITLPPDHDVPGLLIQRNSSSGGAGTETVERGALGTPVPIDPGKITFVVSAPGRIAQTVDVVVTTGAATTFTIPALEVAPTPPAAPVPTAPAGDNPAPAPESTNEWQRPTGLIVGGVGVVTGAIGGILALTAKSSYNSAFSSGHCTQGSLTCDATGQSQTDGARTQANVGGVLFGVGAALAVGGGVLYFLAPHAAAPTTGMRLVPSVGPGTASLDVTGGF